MSTIYDTAMTLIPPQAVATSTSFPPVDAGAVRDLGTTSWVTNLTQPPAAPVTFVLEAATLVGGTYTELARLVYPGGVTGNRSVDLGACTSLSGALSGTHRWLRVTTVQSGSFTGSSWLSKPGGLFGLASKPGATVAVV
jgi:hypothetical protein